MGISSPASITNSVDNQMSDHGSEADLLSYQDEIEHLRAAKRQAEIKLALLQKRYEEEASLFSDTRVSNIFKINGAREYLEGLKEKVRIKDEIIKNLREDLEFKKKEVLSLRDRCRNAEKRSREYLKAFKDAQMARDRLEIENKVSPIGKEAARVFNYSANMSSASSLNGSQVPPPPPINVPTIDEMLKIGASSQEDDISPYVSLNLSVPPPPDVDVPLYELTKQSGDKKAFLQEQGHFVCHIYATVELESSKETLSDIVELVEAEIARSPGKTAYQNWKVIDPGVNESSGNPCNVSDRFHVTLLRGHRVIYYHQISHMLSYIETVCNSSSSFCLCLDKLRLFNNHEGNKQFLCLATRSIDSPSNDQANLEALKKRIRDAVDQFATRLTEEDETDDTLAHCSLMYREIEQAGISGQDSESNLIEIEKLCEENLDDYPICLVKVDKINVKIGNRTYEYILAKH